MTSYVTGFIAIYLENMVKISFPKQDICFDLQDLNNPVSRYKRD